MRCYKIVKFCKLCKARFVIEGNKFVSSYCPACYKKYIEKRDTEKDDTAKDD